MKKKILAVAMAVMCMAGSVNTVFASTFVDINNVPWPGAAAYIDEAASLGLMAGYTENGQKYCKAKNSVTYNEVVQLMYSIMCSYNSNNKATSAVISKWTPVMKNANIPSWAYECVAYSLENAILSANDLSIFMLNATSQNNARREDVAVIFGKALAKIHNVNYSATLNYNDKNLVSASSVPYIELLNRLGLMVGDANNNFNPKANINRAEMAVLSTKTYKALKNNTTTPSKPNIPTNNEQVVGEVADISSDTITIIVNGKERKIDVSSSATITYDGKEAELRDINEKDNAVVVIIDGKAAVINAYPVYGASTSNIKKGMITSISKTRITIEDGNKKSTYKFDKDYNDVSLKLDGKTSYDIDDLIDFVEHDKKNIEVEITADRDDYVTKIVATTSEKSDLEGEVTSLSSSKITIKSNGKSYSYYLLDETDDISVKIDGKTEDFREFRDLYDDEKITDAKLTLNSHKEVTKIEASTKSSSSSTSGTIRSIDKSEIKVKTSSGSYKTYDIKSSTKVYIDGSSSSLSTLISRVDDGKEYKVKVSVSGSTATKIDAERTDSKDDDKLSGQIMKVNLYEIQVKDRNGRYNKYSFASQGCDFTIDGRFASINTVISKYGDGSSSSVKANIKLNGADRATKVDIVTNSSSSTSDAKKGSLRSISSRNDEIEITLDSGSKKRYDLDSDCSVYIDGSKSSVSKLERKFDDDEEFEVELTLNSRDEVTKIKASTSKGEKKGRLYSIDSDRIIVDVDGTKYKYDLYPGATIIVDGDEVDFDRFVNHDAVLYKYDVTITRNSEGDVKKIVATKVR